MRTQTAMLLLTLLMAIPGPCLAWDLTYDGDVLPTDPALGPGSWALNVYSAPGVVSDSSTTGGVLHLSDQRTDQAALFFRDDVPPNSPVTIEARLRVTSADGAYIALVEPLRFGGSLAFVGIWPDRVGVRYRGNNYFDFYSVDMTQFHVVRLAIEENPWPYRVPAFTVWVDGVQVFSGSAPGTTGGSVHFGTNLIKEFTSESYWDYVRYSREYVPVPEPSGLLALTSGLTGLLAMRRRRGAG